ADLKSRIYQIQMKEISCKSILANLDRFIQFVWSKVFYRAEKFKIYLTGYEGNPLSPPVGEAVQEEHPLDPPPFCILPFSRDCSLIFRSPFATCGMPTKADHDR
ncbi:MAG: hypothetical protein WC620_11450, partial [Methanoregula sp.]